MNILERAPRYGRVGAAGGVANLDFVRYIRAEKDVDYNGGPLGTGIRNADMVIDTVGGRMLKPRARLEASRNAISRQRNLPARIEIGQEQSD